MSAPIFEERRIARPRRGAQPVAGHEVDEGTDERPEVVLLVTGSRAMAATDEALHWTRRELRRVIRPHRRDTLRFIVGGAPGVDAQARMLGIWEGAPVDAFLLNGRVDPGPRRKGWSWYDGPRIESPTWPLRRNDAMIAAAVAACRAGAVVKAVTLYAPWSPTRGTLYTRDRAALAGLLSVALDCPMELGPPTAHVVAELPQEDA